MNRRVTDKGLRRLFPDNTGVSLTTRDHESDYKRVTMADLLTECNYLNPDVEVIADLRNDEAATVERVTREGV